MTSHVPADSSADDVTPVTADASATARPRGPLWLRVLLVPVAMLVGALSPTLIQVPLSWIPGAREWFNNPANLHLSVWVDVVIRAMPTITALFFVWLLITRLDRRRLRDAGVLWTRDSLRLLGLGLAVSAVVVLVTATTLQSSARPFEASGLPLWFAIYVAIANAILLQGFPEELFFRGYLMQTMRAHPLAAVAVSAVVFGAMHWVSAGGQQNALERFLYLLNPMAFGFCAAALVLLTRSLWPAVGVHAGLHLANLVAVLLGLSVEGPMLWVASAVGYVIVGVVALSLWRKRGGRAPVVLDR